MGYIYTYKKIYIYIYTLDIYLYGDCKRIAGFLLLIGIMMACLNACLRSTQILGGCEHWRWRFVLSSAGHLLNRGMALHACCLPTTELLDRLSGVREISFSAQAPVLSGISSYTAMPIAACDPFILDAGHLSL